MSDPDCVGGGVDVDYRTQTPFRQALPARMEGPGPPNRDGPGRNAVLPPARLRTDWRVRREGVDRRGRRLLLEPEEVRQENRAHGPVHKESARAALLPSLRQVASMEDPGLDQPPLHLAVPPLENGLEGLVLACGALGLGIRPDVALAFSRSQRLHTPGGRVARPPPFGPILSWRRYCRRGCMSTGKEYTIGNAEA